MKKSFKEITIMNAFLCFCVVLIHLTSAPLGQLIPKSIPHILIFIINKALCFCVPGFLFLSGFKLYNKYKNEKVKLKSFYGRRLEKIVIPYLIAVLVYFIYFYIKGWVEAKELPQYIFLGTLAAHFYYVVIAVQCYLLFPLLKVLFKKMPTVTLVLSLLCTCYFQHYFTFLYSDRFIGSYIFYFIAGFAVAKFNVKKIYGPAVCVMLFSGAAHIYFSYLQLTEGYFYQYANLVNIVYVTSSIFALYLIFDNIKNNFIYSFSKTIGGVSYNVYLYHILIIFIMQYEFFPKYPLLVKEQLLISTAVIYGLIIIYGYMNKKR